MKQSECLKFLTLDICKRTKNSPVKDGPSLHADGKAATCTLCAIEFATRSCIAVEQQTLATILEPLRSSTRTASPAWPLPKTGAVLFLGRTALLPQRAWSASGPPTATTRAVVISGCWSAGSAATGLSTTGIATVGVIVGRGVADGISLSGFAVTAGSGAAVGVGLAIVATAESTAGNTLGNIAAGASVGASVGAGVDTDVGAGVATAGAILSDSIAANPATADANAVGVSPPDSAGNFAAKVAPACIADALSVRDPDSEKKYMRFTFSRFCYTFGRVGAGSDLQYPKKLRFTGLLGQSCLVP